VEGQRKLEVVTKTQKMIPPFWTFEMGFLSAADAVSVHEWTPLIQKRVTKATSGLGITRVMALRVNLKIQKQPDLPSSL